MSFTSTTACVGVVPQEEYSKFSIAVVYNDVADSDCGIAGE